MWRAPSTPPGRAISPRTATTHTGRRSATGAPPRARSAVPWRFQGRILESASAGTDLYDFGARSYDPSLGSFTSFDSVSGSAQNPATLNRYLYGNANPATLVDPDGHQSLPASCNDHPCYSTRTTSPPPITAMCGSAPDPISQKACNAALTAQKQQAAAKKKSGSGSGTGSGDSGGGGNGGSGRSSDHPALESIFDENHAFTVWLDDWDQNGNRVRTYYEKFVLPDGSSDFWQWSYISSIKLYGTPEEKQQYEAYLHKNGAYALYLVTHHNPSDPDWAYQKGIWQTAMDYLHDVGCPSTCIQSTRSATTTLTNNTDYIGKPYFSSSSTVFVEDMPDDSLVLNTPNGEWVAGSVEAAAGAVEVGSGFFSCVVFGAECDAFSDGASHLGAGLSSVVALKDNRPFKNADVPLWSVSVDWSKDSVTAP